MSYTLERLILKNKIHRSCLSLARVDFAHQMGNEMFIVMRSIMIITEEVVSPCPPTTSPNPLRDSVE